MKSDRPKKPTVSDAVIFVICFYYLVCSLIFVNVNFLVIEYYVILYRIVRKNL